MSAVESVFSVSDSVSDSVFDSEYAPVAARLRARARLLAGEEMLRSCTGADLPAVRAAVDQVRAADDSDIRPLSSQDLPVALDPERYADLPGGDTVLMTAWAALGTMVRCRPGSMHDTGAAAYFPAEEELERRGRVQLHRLYLELDRWMERHHPTLSERLHAIFLEAYRDLAAEVQRLVQQPEPAGHSEPHSRPRQWRRKGHVALLVNRSPTLSAPNQRWSPGRTTDHAPPPVVTDGT